jgi:hypothetical protein
MAKGLKCHTLNDMKQLTGVSVGTLHKVLNADCSVKMSIYEHVLERYDMSISVEILRKS